MVQSLRKVGRPKSLYVEAMCSIKDAIFRDVYRPGETLPSEKELSAQLGVSRPVLREALRALESQGFLEIRRGSRGGAYVTDLNNISFKDNLTELLRTGKLSMDEVTEARLHLEPEVFRQAALHASDQQLAEIRALVEKRQCLQDRVERIRIDSDFHRLVSKASNNPLYSRFMQIIFDFVEVFATTLEPEDFHVHDEKDHPAILAALLARDGDRVAALVHEHTKKVTASMIELENQWLQALGREGGLE
ncbi:MAG: FadR/GntR family transcriptional regulator [Desulfopila sp.]